MLTEQLLLREISCGSSDTAVQCDDQIVMYARELLSLGMLLAEFKDAVKEGDGHRVIRVWKFLLPTFSAANRKNYAIQALTLLAKRYYIFSPRMQQQLIWSRFINTRGVPGGNKEMDLHMEHINRTVKLALASQGSNTKPNSILRIGKITGALLSITKQFDEHSHVSTQGSKHADVSYKNDIKKIVCQLHNKTEVFYDKLGRKHRSFSKLNGHITQSLCAPLNYEKFIDWMKKQFHNLTH